MEQESVPEKIELILPLVKWEIGGSYGLKIEDSSGKTYYFNHDGSSDGFSRETRLIEN